jgi:hypothetical protein
LDAETDGSVGTGGVQNQVCSEMNVRDV